MAVLLAAFAHPTSRRVSFPSSRVPIPLPARTPTGLLWPTIATGVAFALLMVLGSWQLERKAWKEGLIAQISARAHAVPLSLDDAIDQSARGRNLEYARVSVSGRFHPDKTLYLFAPEAGETGWHAYVPLETASGRLVLVNRGWISQARRNEPSPPSNAPQSEVHLVGLLRHPGSAGTFTPPNDVSRNIWHWRDVAAMARAAFPAEASRVLLFTIDREADPAGRAEPGAPRGGVTRVVLPNRHLEYALTWYGLGFTLLGVYATFSWSRWRSRRRSSTTSPSRGGL